MDKIENNPEIALDESSNLSRATSNPSQYDIQTLELDMRCLSTFEVRIIPQRTTLIAMATGNQICPFGACA